MIMFPVVILLGAGGKVVGEKANRLCKFLGDISYPIYITHFPLVYVYMAWIVNGKHTLEESQSWILGFVIVFISILLAYCFMKFYDIPVRKWLSKKLISKK
ncbi:hypothetical protein GCM10023210_27740 [Chryseobacterium ginsengisoli]|uniref:Acyltransferase 3 domain-containing protein n=2 Tax=Chryseobacterium ginsengisoli TaxID=363853 RepID=A0ABP9MF27_9FLAO